VPLVQPMVATLGLVCEIRNHCLLRLVSSERIIPEAVLESLAVEHSDAIHRYQGPRSY